MAYAFNDDKSKVELDGIVKTIDLYSVIDSIPANSKAGERIDLTNLIPDGYTFIGIISVNTVDIAYDNKNLALLGFYPETIISPSQEEFHTAFVSLRNLSSTPYTNVSVRVRVLLIKNIVLD